MARKSFWAAVVLAALCFLKYLPGGLVYYPILDDYIQYWGYLQFENIWSDIVIRLGLLHAHPLASLADVYVWGGLFKYGFFPVFFITQLHIISAFLFVWAFDRSNIGAGLVFAFVFLLFPAGFEGAYWLSASSRIVIGLFFTAVTANMLVSWLKYPKKRLGVLFFLFALASFLFYEQVAALAVGMYAIIIYINKKSKAALKAFAGLAGCVLAVSVYYLLFSSMGRYGYRARLVELGDLGQRVAELFGEFSRLVSYGFIKMTAEGFLDGMKILFKNPVWLIIITALCLILANLCEPSGKFKKSDIFIGVLFFILPFLPFFILAEGGLAIRSGFCSIIGLGIAVACLIRFKKRAFLYRSVIFVLVFVFMATNISLMQDYKEISIIDAKICRGIADNLDTRAKNGLRDVVVYQTGRGYLEQSQRLKPHIASLTQSDWALTGGVRFYAKNMKITRVIPEDLVTGEILDKKPLALYMDKDYNIYRK